MSKTHSDDQRQCREGLLCHPSGGILLVALLAAHSTLLRGAVQLEHDLLTSLQIGTVASTRDRQCPQQVCIRLRQTSDQTSDRQFRLGSPPLGGPAGSSWLRCRFRSPLIDLVHNKKSVVVNKNCAKSEIF